MLFFYTKLAGANTSYCIAHVSTVQCTHTRACYTVTMRMRRAGSEDWGMGMRLYLCGRHSSKGLGTRLVQYLTRNGANSFTLFGSLPALAYSSVFAAAQCRRTIYEKY